MSPTKKDSKIQSEVGKDIPDGTDKVPLDQTLFELDADEYDAFASLLDDPPPAGPALKGLMKRRPLWQK
jgi:uncharacterized protein (DUF1778 family)